MPFTYDTLHNLLIIVSVKAYGVLAPVSSCCPPPKGKFLRVTHPSAT